MTETKLRTRKEEALAEARALAKAADTLEGDDLERFNELTAEVEQINGRLKVLDAYRQGGATESGDGAQGPQYMKRNDPYEHPGKPESAGEVRSRALNAVESWNADDRIKEDATRTIERAGQGSPDGAADTRGVAGHVLRYSSPLYISAFRKYSRDPSGYIADLTPDERRVWQEARQHQRAVLQTTGAVLPSPLDPTIVLTSDGAIDPMRGIARVDTTTSKTKRYITSAGSTFSFDAENTEVSDDTFTEAEVEINTHKAQGFIQATIETWMDQPDFSSEVAKIIADGKAVLEAGKWISGAGDGSNEPFGIQTELDGTSSELSPATTEVFAAEDVFSTLEGVPPRFRANAVFMAELSTINEIQQFETSNGAPLFPGVDSANPTLLRRRLVENSNVDAHSDINVAATADNFILYAGDFSQYVILDRVGLTVAFIEPGVLQNTANNLPDGRVGWYAYWRTGAESLVDGAFRVMNIATTA